MSACRDALSVYVGGVLLDEAGSGNTVLVLHLFYHISITAFLKKNISFFGTIQAGNLPQRDMLELHEPILLT